MTDDSGHSNKFTTPQPRFHTGSQHDLTQALRRRQWLRELHRNASFKYDLLTHDALARDVIMLLREYKSVYTSIEVPNDYRYTYSKYNNEIAVFITLMGIVSDRSLFNQMYQFVDFLLE